MNAFEWIGEKLRSKGLVVSSSAEGSFTIPAPRPRLRIHRKEQWDLDCWPLVCVHRYSENASSRVFCLWWRGIQIGSWLWVWSKPAQLRVSERRAAKP